MKISKIQGPSEPKFAFLYLDQDPDPDSDLQSMKKSESRFRTKIQNKMWNTLV